MRHTGNRIGGSNPPLSASARSCTLQSIPENNSFHKALGLPVMP
jgi:hypothetical protein